MRTIEVCKATDVAKRVLTAEAQAISTLASRVPPDLPKVVEAFAAVEGRVIVSGIGKSGHIGKKIAATLASTGTPASFVHPCEASHGDLGMVTRKDICLVISNSGETSELKSLIAHCLKLSIHIVGISKNPNSSLMAASTYRLSLPDLAEACAIGVAPTTSTAMTLALGDALAVATMELKGFSKEQFSVLHPGGSLGAKLATVQNIMHGQSSVPTVSMETAMGDTIVAMTSGGFGIAAVVNCSGILAGVVTDGDIRRNLDNLLAHSAFEVATKSPVTVPPNLLASEAMALMKEKNINALIVVSEKAPVGILTLHDCVRAGL